MFCGNQLRLAFSQAKKSGARMSIRHNGDWDSKLDSSVRPSRASWRAASSSTGGWLPSLSGTSQEPTSWLSGSAFKVLDLTKTDLESEAGELKVKGFVNAATATYEEERSLGCPDSCGWLPTLLPSSSSTPSPSEAARLTRTVGLLIMLLVTVPSFLATS